MSIARRTSRRRSTPPRDYSQAFFVSPGILGTGRPIPRVLYKYWNEHFASPLDNVSVNSRNCRYPFRDGNIWCPNPSGNIPPAYDGLAKCDYALPEPLATSLMNTIKHGQGHCLYMLNLQRGFDACVFVAQPVFEMVSRSVAHPS